MFPCGTARSRVFTNGAANSRPEYRPKKGIEELLWEQRIHYHALDRPENVAESENRHHQPDHRVAVAPQPVQVALRTGFTHEQHDSRAAVEWRNRQQVKRSEQQIEKEEDS